MSDTEKDTHEYLQNVQDAPIEVPPSGTGEGKRTFRQKTRRHCARWWWLHLLIFIAVLLIIVLPVVYVAYPKIAQDDVNKSVLNVTSMNFKNPTADSFELELSSVLTTHVSYEPTLNAFNASLFLAGTMVEFLQLPIPKTHAVNGTVTNINTPRTLNSTDAFAQYAAAMIQNETVIVYLKGRTGLKEGGLPTTTVNYDKTITLTGFNGLSGLTISNLTLLTTTQPDGANMAGLVRIPNPTVQTLNLGNMTLSLSLPTNITNTTSPVLIGTSTINNTVLIPSSSNNIFEMRSTTNETLLLEYLEKMPSLAGPDGLPVLIQGTNAEVDGVQIPWLVKALQEEKSVFSYDLQISDALIKAGLGALVPGYTSTSSSATASATVAASSTSVGSSATTTAAVI